MVEKINEFGVMIKTLLNQLRSQVLIARKLKIRRKNVNLQAKNPIKKEKKEEEN